jgi:hypothetical protein
MELAIVVAGRFWLEISLRKTGKERQTERKKERKKKSIQEKKKKNVQERQEMASEQPSSTADIR